MAASKLVLLMVFAGLASGARVAPEGHWLRAQPSAGPLPVVLWHGMGDSCCSVGSIGAIKALLEDKLGVFVHSIATGAGEMGDVVSGFYGNLNDQVGTVCGELRRMKELEGGFNLIGFSQGGQFARAVVQRCGHELPRIHTLVTLGAQHQGVMNTPGCAAELAGAGASACTVMQTMLARGAYAFWVRTHIVQAQYFKDPFHLDDYLTYNIFLPDINNELPKKHGRYAKNLAALDKLVLLRFDNDTTVVPRDSAWFSFFNGTDLIPLTEQPLYKEDWLGLRTLDEAGRLVLGSAPGEHMRFTPEWFEQNVIDPYLRGGDSPEQPASADA